jgi:hypothetical protein
MNRHMVWALVAIMGCAFFMSAPSAEADKKWLKLASLSAGSGAKEVAVNRECREFQIRIKEGSVIFNTIVVREGGKTTPIRVARRFEKGGKHEFVLPAKTHVTGLRISDDGRGQYDVFVRH